MDTIGGKLKELRKTRKITQAEMAEHLKVSRSYYSELESDSSRMKVEHLIEAAKYLGVPLNYFSESTPEQTLFETMAELSSFFTSEGVSENDKDKAYQDIMRIYLNSKELLRSEHESNDKTDTINRENAEGKCEQ